MKIRQFNPAPIVLIGLCRWRARPRRWRPRRRDRRRRPRQQPSADQVTVPLSDPSRPGLIDVSLVQGSITVRGTNRKDVLVDRPSGNGSAEPPLRSGRHRHAPHPADRGLPHLRRRQSHQGRRPTVRTVRSPSRSRRRRAPTSSCRPSTAARSSSKTSKAILTVSNTNGGITLNNVAGIGQRRHHQRQRPRHDDARDRRTRKWPSRR